MLVCFPKANQQLIQTLGPASRWNNGRQLAECQVFQDELKLRVMGRLGRWERPLSRWMQSMFILMKGVHTIWSSSATLTGAGCEHWCVCACVQPAMWVMTSCMIPSFEWTHSVKNHFQASGSPTLCLPVSKRGIPRLTAWIIACQKYPRWNWVKSFRRWYWCVQFRK